MTSGQETDRAYSNKKPQLPEPVWGTVQQSWSKDYNQQQWDH